MIPVESHATESLFDAAELSVRLSLPNSKAEIRARGDGLQFYKWGNSSRNI